MDYLGHTDHFCLPFRILKTYQQLSCDYFTYQYIYKREGELVIDYFMGLKTVKLKYRLIPIIWLGTVLSLIALAYYLPVATVQ